MVSLKFFFFAVLVIACVAAFPGVQEDGPGEAGRAKKDVLLGYGYNYPAYSSYYRGLYPYSYYY